MGHNRICENVDKFLENPTINRLFSRLYRRFIKLYKRRNTLSIRVTMESTGGYVFVFQLVTIEHVEYTIWCTHGVLQNKTELEMTIKSKHAINPTSCLISHRPLLHLSQFCRQLAVISYLLIKYKIENLQKYGITQNKTRRYNVIEHKSKKIK